MDKKSIRIVKYNKFFLKRSWQWLNDPEIKELTLTPDFTLEQQIEWFNNLLNRKDYLIWGIELDNNPIGVCGIKNISGLSGEYWGYIGEKRFWRQGFGRWILNQMLNKAMDLGLSKVWLRVSCNNERAIRLYEHFSFNVQNCEHGIMIMERELYGNKAF
jgi:RimJ/RimL family protein N-acetyltransferase